MAVRAARVTFILDDKDMPYAYYRKNYSQRQRHTIRTAYYGLLQKLNNYYSQRLTPGFVSIQIRHV